MATVSRTKLDVRFSKIMHKLGEKKLIEQIMAQTFLDPVLAVAKMPGIRFRIWRFWEIRASLWL